MKKFKKYLLLSALAITFVSCNNEDEPVANNVVLEFQNTFGDTPIVLGDATSTSATVNTSTSGQVHHFSELKYVISNIRLVKANGTEIPYNVNNLDTGATVIDQSKPATLNYVLSNIPVGDYAKIKLGLGVKQDLNTLDQARFPNFYAKAGANDTQMHWEWGTGYRFTKTEGFYGASNATLSFHSGSTVEGTEGNTSTYVPGFNSYRDITLNLTTNAIVGKNAPKIKIKADFNALLSGKTNTITITSSNAVPSAHTSANMSKIVNNIGGDGTIDTTGMFSISAVNN